MYYLYIKTHNVTGLKYLGKTKNKDPYAYKRSGEYWKRHISKHGYDVTTEILKECSSNEEVREWGLYYSKLWNVVEERDEYGNKTWANLKEESGDSGDPSNLESFKNYIATRRDYSGENNPFYGKTHHKKTCAHLAELASKQWKGVPKSENHKHKIALGNTGKVFPEERKKNISKACTGRTAHNKGVPAKKYFCVYCEQDIAGASNFTRWHNNNCKKRNKKNED